MHTLLTSAVSQIALQEYGEVKAIYSAMISVREGFFDERRDHTPGLASKLAFKIAMLPP